MHQCLYCLHILQLYPCSPEYNHIFFTKSGIGSCLKSRNVNFNVATYFCCTIAIFLLRIKNIGLFFIFFSKKLLLSQSSLCYLFIRKCRSICVLNVLILQSFCLQNLSTVWMKIFFTCLCRTCFSLWQICFFHWLCILFFKKKSL